MEGTNKIMQQGARGKRTILRQKIIGAFAVVSGILISGLVITFAMRKTTILLYIMAKEIVQWEEVAFAIILLVVLYIIGLALLVFSFEALRTIRKIGH